MSYRPYPKNKTERKVMDILRSTPKGFTTHEFHTFYHVLRAQAALQAMGDRGLLLTTVRTAGNEVRFSLRDGRETWLPEHLLDKKLGGFEVTIGSKKGLTVWAHGKSVITGKREQEVVDAIASLVRSMLPEHMLAATDATDIFSFDIDSDDGDYLRDD